MSLATFDDTMLDITLELDDREIYNDIRSQVDVTVITPGDTSWTTWTKDDQAIKIFNDETLSPSSSASYTLYPRTGTSAEVWGTPVVEARYYAVNVFTDVSPTVVVTASTYNYITFTVYNNSPAYTMYLDTAKCTYTGKYYEKVVGNSTTGTETLTVRATDATSIALYGRSVMNLTWPLGQTHEQTEALAYSYLARYKDPVIRVKMTIIGKTDALIEEIYTRDISDLITVINTSLGLNADFYINKMDIYHDPFGLPTAEWTLEYQRTNETYTLFTLDTSELDGTHVLAY